MATSEQKVKAAHPRAAKKRYSKTSGGSYHLIWSGFPEGRDSMRLGSGKTASEAWVDAAKNIERVAAQAPAQQRGKPCGRYMEAKAQMPQLWLDGHARHKRQTLPQV